MQVGSMKGDGPDAFVDLLSVEMLPRAAVEQNISLILAANARRGADPTTITLDIGPGLCAYTYTHRPLCPWSTNESLALSRVRRVPVLSTRIMMVDLCASGS